MNTLISIVMAIVLNFLGVEMQEQQLLANSEQQTDHPTNILVCDSISEKNYSATLECLE